MVDEPDSESGDESRGGSSPLRGTNLGKYPTQGIHLGEIKWVGF